MVVLVQGPLRMTICGVGIQWTLCCLIPYY